MLDSEITDISWDFLKNTDETMRACADWFERTGGNFADGDEALDFLIPYLQLNKINDGNSRYLWCGDLSTVGELFGRDFAASAPGKAGVPDVEFDFVMSSVYFPVLSSGKPVHQRVRSDIDVWGSRYDVDYYRFVFPVLIGGMRAVGVMCRFEGMPTVRMHGQHGDRRRPEKPVLGVDEPTGGHRV